MKSEALFRLEHLWAMTQGSSVCGWMVDEVANFVGSLIVLYKPSLVIQTGHLWGKSAFYVLEALTNFESFEPMERMGDPAYRDFVLENTPKRSKCKLISVDPSPLGVGDFQVGVTCLKDWYGDAFEFHQMPSEKFFAQFKCENERIVGIVDGDHTRDGCGKDIDALMGLGAELIIVDDTAWLPELNVVCSVLPYKHVRFPYYNGISVLVK